jgi:hypothetical protein
MRNTTKSFPVQDATPLPQMARLDRTDFRSPKQKSPSDPHESFGLPSQCQTNVIGGPTETALATTSSNCSRSEIQTPFVRRCKRPSATTMPSIDSGNGHPA